MSSIGGIDSSVLLGYYQAQLSSSPSALAAASSAQAAAAAATNTGATANDNPPWNTITPSNAAQDAKVLSTTNFLDTSNVPLSAGATADTKMEQDNQKLFSLYSAVNTLAYLSKMAQSSTATDGQLVGLNSRFQTGLAQIESYLSGTSFNNFNLQSAKPSDTASSTAAVQVSDYVYSTKYFVTNSNINNPVPGVSASDSFTINIKKGGTTTAVPIDLSQVQGGLTLGNIVSYVNSQLSAAGFSTRFQKTVTGDTATSSANATYGLQITPGGTEQVSLSASATPALYMAGNSGSATESNTVTATSTVTTTAADQAGRLTKLTGLDGTPTATYSVNQAVTNGTSTAQASVVDSSGNVYVLGTTTGDIQSQINQAGQDVYLTKYDSAGNVVWQNLLGSGGNASGYGLALDPSGGIVVTGSSTAPLTTTAIANGNNDSFVARYNANGEQSWIQQIQTLATNQANSVSVDASGNIYIGGAVSGGVIGAGQSAQGGRDAFLVKMSAQGKVLAENQFGTSGSDSVGATATDANGNLFVASVQNGHAIVAKYANGDITSAPAWTEDLGALQAGGTIGGLTVANGKIYVSGSTSNGNLTAGGQASIAVPASGGVDAFVTSLTDNGSSATANTTTYVGTSGTDTGGDVTVGSDGTIYLTGSTTGSFAGSSRTVANVTNAFATALNSDGTVKWTKQFGGASGTSTGAGLAIDTSGSSVLDALGLPRGAIQLNQSVDLTTQTTLRAGDSFQLQIQGVAARTATITIDPGETYDSLVTKINAQLGSVGKASINYGGGGETLQIKVNTGQTVNLMAGPANFDALSRLGITAGVITSASTATSTASSTTSTSTVKKTYGLGLTGNNVIGDLDISTKTGANLARSTLLSVLSNIQSIYQTTNAPPTTNTPKGNTSGTASSAALAQLSNYNVALGLMTTDPSNAVANIQSILNNANSGGGNSALLSALQSLGAS